ncbi:molecular chaperone [Cronobacter dublinensis]|uniref:TorD/DmsD family molecular chaperone n=1 Tax=Cronobacter dublinensis TaxID=413497 RepID=UPI0013758206|nr:molecular chaperone [Cronobacter dublinensis]EKY3090104.1 molecular chaperone [Cronobacter dublinensis]ELQ6229553.1 molecular chaperone [Cronobacter dublinensis]ELY4006275.1 molecular chaperone [Cronobacter dublinensis]ELY4409268.1 molecular chaperone [Cronobacter dublinensis]ELY5820420.1 molecular chaperone [Cronobacter dublinensis]
MNEFSIICRLLGSLWYRAPQDPVMAPIYGLIRDGKLAQNWPLEQDELLARLQKSAQPEDVQADYQALFGASDARVAPVRSAWVEQGSEQEVRAFLTARGMPLGEAPADHFGLLLLAASWLEDQSAEDEIEAQETLFGEFLIPWYETFLGKAEAHAATPFWRTLAQITREAIQAMWEELQEDEDEGEEADDAEGGTA